jgi:hypothetical protein
MKDIRSLCGHCCRIFSPESFNVDEEDETIIKNHSRIHTLPRLPSLQKAASSGCTFCNELKERILAHSWPDNVRNITMGPATLLHETFWEVKLTPEQEDISTQCSR